MLPYHTDNTCFCGFSVQYLVFTDILYVRIIQINKVFLGCVVDLRNNTDKLNHQQKIGLK